MKISIISKFEAYIYIASRQIRMWSGHGNVRALVEEFLKPIHSSEPAHVPFGMRAAAQDDETAIVEIKVA